MKAAALALGTVLALGPAWAQPFNAIAVNTPKGVACPALFGGKEAIAFPGAKAVEIGQILLNHDRCEAAFRALELRKEESGLRKALDGAQSGLIETMKARAAILEAALEKSEKRGNLLQEALDGSKWRWLWSMLGGLAAATGLAIGLKYGMR